MNRNVMLALLVESKSPWDVLVIGGGATGLGIAVDAAARGYRTLLLEQQDFAKGTSSRSTKLIHGGLRYLKQGNIRLVRESLHERGLLIRNAPHLVSPLAFVIPCYRRHDQVLYGVGLKVYDALAGSLGIGRSKSMDPSEVSTELPGIQQRNLHGGVRYWDGQFDDTRLAIALAQTAADLGATLLNYFQVTSLKKTSGRISGVVARDAETGQEYEVAARTVINATGVFADHVRGMDERAMSSYVAPSRGAHIVLPKSFLPGASALMIPHTNDNRVLFAIPWNEHVLVGTTDNPALETSLEPKPTSQEIQFLLEHMGRHLSQQPTTSDILSTFAGLRPLSKASGTRNTALLPRDHHINASPSGLLTVTGGKWTTYRHMAEETLDNAVRIGGLPPRKCPTRDLHLHGWATSGEQVAPTALKVYGTDAPLIADLARSNPVLQEKLHPALPYIGAEVIWALRNSMARTLEDILARRIRALFLNARASIEMAPRVAALIAQELNKDAAWEQDQVNSFRHLAQGYLG
ncbi:MAG TPA: glycerol-3-phosphate dehydrogenase/oxidase [Candidatus Saccharimonadales bacterium]|nr:glycerol-3-phosphate dehydrogenase/oxidase [Candidatus Saccharimonadales bacterium]